MGQRDQNSGLSNSAYANWLSNTAASDCSEVEELFIQYTNDDEQTLTDSEAICELMGGATESMVATFREVKFSGHDAQGQPWYAIDERLTVNLERTVNYGNVPIKIKRPTGS